MRFGNMEGLEIAHILRQNGVQIFCDLDTGYLDEEKEIFYQELDYAVFNHIGFRNYRGKRTEEEAAQQLLCFGEDYEKAAEYASAAAAICVSGVGARAGAVSENEVRCFLKKQGLDY